MAWAVWFSRNSLVMKLKKENAASTLIWAKKFINQFKDARISDQSITIQQSESSISKSKANSGKHSSKKKRPTWSPPPASSFKLNTDASVSSSAPAFCLGTIVRCYKSVVLTVGSFPRSGSLSTDQAEAIAILGNQFRGFFNLIVESDVLEVIKLINRVSSALHGIEFTVIDFT